MKHLTLGIDVGSSSVKVAIARSTAGDDAVLLATAVQRLRRRNAREVAHDAIAEACATAGLPVPAADGRPYDYVASTGEAETLDGLTGHFYGMT
ncbi:MAG: benzoyl-CoA reductase subunit D, partial [Polyangiales bacterium]